MCSCRWPSEKTKLASEAPSLGDKRNPTVVGKRHGERQMREGNEAGDGLFANGCFPDSLAQWLGPSCHPSSATKPGTSWSSMYLGIRGILEALA